MLPRHARRLRPSQVRGRRPGRFSIRWCSDCDLGIASRAIGIGVQKVNFISRQRQEAKMLVRLILSGATAFLYLAPHGVAQALDLVRVSDGPFVSGGGYYIAREKGYFQKLGIEIQHREFMDGSLAVPAIVSGELDISGMTAAAGLFNSVAKGAPLGL